MPCGCCRPGFDVHGKNREGLGLHPPTYLWTDSTNQYPDLARGRRKEVEEEINFDPFCWDPPLNPFDGNKRDYTEIVKPCKSRGGGGRRRRFYPAVTTDPPHGRNFLTDSPGERSYPPRCMLCRTWGKEVCVPRKNTTPATFSLCLNI
ncbi:hypothetical protein chiPu_0004486 [Chiloscyllium punctatum]|uniref:Uncharacterized protein n=1 Tax=Chiloscyllium punctatum TaxID=137246 RepID=A0A401S6P6_CHIPU|nr:hypothetical protein [Chiloscyllium punctatum]